MARKKGKVERMAPWCPSTWLGGYQVMSPSFVAALGNRPCTSRPVVPERLSTELGSGPPKRRR